MGKRLRFLLLLLSFIGVKAQAQLSVSDSSFFESIFVEPLYVNPNLPGTQWYRLPEVKSRTQLYQQIENEYPFKNHELLGAYQAISFTGGIRLNDSVNAQIKTYNQQFNAFLFGIHNPFVELPFQLNNKSAVASALRDSASFPNPTKAFVIFSGSGDNQLTRLTVNNNDDHNTNCNVRQFLKDYGDVYILGIANEDERAIRYKGKKLGRYYPNMPTHLQDTLNDMGQAMGVNRVIESIAWIKYLKSNYDEVHILGLSMGGTEALWTALMTKPKTALIASGYSVLFDTDSTFQTVNGYFYANYMNHFVKDTVRTLILQSPTKFWFTRGVNDLPIFTTDSMGKFTESYFWGVNQCGFYSNFHNHTFPPCSWIDSMINQLNVPNEIVVPNEQPLTVYPNPFQNEFMVTLPEGTFNISVYDILGRKISTYLPTQHQQRIQTQHWPSGTYFLHIQSKSVQGHHVMFKE